MGGVQTADHVADEMTKADPPRRSIERLETPFDQVSIFHLGPTVAFGDAHDFPVRFSLYENERRAVEFEVFAVAVF